MQESTNGVATVDDLLNRAFQLSYLLIGNRMTAVGIAMVAMDNLKVATSIQHKRHSYVPTGTSVSRATRTKVSLSDVHLFQRLVYIESEIFERLQEQQEGSVRQEDLLIHFVKHLVRIAIKRNSFYVSLALSRVLYNYSTSEAIEIYNLVVQDPDRMRDDYYYRSRKGRLMNELKERFGNLVQTYRNNRREERFRTHSDSERFASLVSECLIRFTPWFTKCVLPLDTELTKNIIKPLLFKGVDPDEEHSIEIDRIHTLLHPNCYRRLVLALGLDPPEQRLEVPYFFLTSGGDGGAMEDRLNPPGLTNQELNAIKSSLDSKARRRKWKSDNSLRVFVDGVERASMELAQSTTIQLEINSNCEVIQVRAGNAADEITLATYLLTHDEYAVLSSESSVTAEGGQKVSFSVTRREGATSDILVTIEYKQTRIIRAALLAFQRLRYRLANSSEWRQRESLRPALTILLLIAALVAAFFYIQSRKTKTDHPVVSQEEEGGSSSPSASNQNEPDTQQPPPGTQRRQPPGGEIATIPGDATGRATRGAQTRSNPAVLLSVSKVYVAQLGDDALSKQCRQVLIDRLRSTNRFTIVETPREADAVLKGTATRISKTMENASVVLRLVNFDGEILWPLRKGAFRHKGNVADAGDKLLRDLLEDIQELQRKK